MDKEKIIYCCPECNSEQLMMHGAHTLDDGDICPLSYFCMCHKCDWIGHEQELKSNKENHIGKMCVDNITNRLNKLWKESKNKK